MTHLDETYLCEAGTGVRDPSNLIEKAKTSSCSSSRFGFSCYKAANRPTSAKRRQFGGPKK